MKNEKKRIGLSASIEKNKFFRLVVTSLFRARIRKMLVTVMYGNEISMYDSGP